MAHRLSLCICTMNRPEDLRKCLASLSGSTAPPCEVLVSDDSRDEAMRRANREVVAAFPGVVYLPGPCRGLSANRNNCLRSVSGDLVVFVDDDVVLDPEFLSKAIAEYDRLRAAHGTDRIVVTGEEIRPEGRGGASALSFFGQYTGRPPSNGSPYAICINSTVFPAALFREADFDENILFGSEERDISFHAAALGYRICFCPDLVNYHYPSPVNRDLYSLPLVTSRFYFGMKRYGLYERSTARLLAFMLVSPTKAVAGRLKVLRFGEAVRVAGAFLEAWKLYRGKRVAPGRRP